MNGQQFLFPVRALIGGPYCPTSRTVAIFFTEADAYKFVAAERGERDLYEGVPRYDRRTSGYRPAEEPSGYEDWLIEIGRTPDNGNVRVAA